MKSGIIVRRRAFLAAGAGTALSTPLVALGQPAPGLREAPMRVGFVHAGKTDIPGWSHQQDLGRRALERELGDAVETAVLAEVSEGQEAERAIRALITRGCRLIFTTAYGFMDPTIRVARESPGILFENATGFKTAENVGVYSARFYEARYLAGLIAGHMSRSGVAGYVASVPIPEVLQGINAFTMAARTVNPAFTVRVIWANSWFDPPRERDAAFALLSQGADLLTHHTDTLVVADVAQEKGRMLIGYHSDLSKVAPTSHLASVTHHWGRYFIQRTREAMEGRWRTDHRWGGLKDDFVRVESISPKVPGSVRRRVRSTSDAIESGKLRLFAGPLVTNDGRVVLADPDSALDDAALHKMDWLTEGVIGRVR